MSAIQIDFSAPCGKVKPMHAVNNAPVGSIRAEYFSNAAEFRRAGIPYCRNHDAAFYAAYGGEYTVDVHNIFRNFDADVNDPASYDFRMTDRYVKSVADVGAETFYRLGSKIEHDVKYGTYPPKDFRKWAEICEHIILHYNEGWADGFHYDLQYWEIWNEADCYVADGSNPCWQGTEEEFIEFYITAHTYLKAKFPHLKIGGPTFCTTFNDPYLRRLFTAMKEAGQKPDFYSFHGYLKTPDWMRTMGNKAYSVMQEFGWEKDTELILDEWNYIEDWAGEGFVASVRAIKGLKGASFTAACMIEAQKSPIDMLMYYDARPCTFNGMFDSTYFKPLKGYYPFAMFGDLYRMGETVSASSDDKDVYVIAAKDGGTAAGFMATYYEFPNMQGEKDVTVSLDNIPAGTKKLQYYLLDDTHDMTLVREDTLTTGTAAVTVNLHFDLFTTVFVKLISEE